MDEALERQLRALGLHPQQQQGLVEPQQQQQHLLGSLLFEPPPPQQQQQRQPQYGLGGLPDLGGYGGGGGPGASLLGGGGGGLAYGAAPMPPPVPVPPPLYPPPPPQQHQHQHQQQQQQQHLPSYFGGGQQQQQQQQQPQQLSLSGLQMSSGGGGGVLPAWAAGLAADVGPPPQQQQHQPPPPYLQQPQPLHHHQQQHPPRPQMRPDAGQDLLRMLRAGAGAGGGGGGGGGSLINGTASAFGAPPPPPLPPAPAPPPPAPAGGLSSSALLAAIPRELMEQAQARGIDPQVFQSMVLEQIEQQRRRQQQQRQDDEDDEQQRRRQRQQQQQQQQLEQEEQQQRTPPPPPRPLAAARRVVPTPPPPPRRSDADALNARLLDLLASKTPSAHEVGRLRDAFEAVERTLLGRWPGARLRLFGSAANGLALSGSNDIDVCLELDGVEDTKEAKGAVIEEVGRLLEEAMYEDAPEQQQQAAGPARGLPVWDPKPVFAEVKAIPTARMPVVKFVHAATGIHADVTVNNRLALANTKLLRDYSAVDPRLRQLALAVKLWAKSRRVNDAYIGTLSSYAYVLMCISHLQRRSPPVLPVLQAMEPKTFRLEHGGWTCEYYDRVAELKGFGAANTETLADLLASFFHYWARQHDYRNEVVTIRQREEMVKADKGWTQRVGTERHLFCIEDPFEHAHDLGRTVGPDGAHLLRREFQRADAVFAGAADVLHDLFERFDPPEPLSPLARGDFGRSPGNAGRGVGRGRGRGKDPRMR